MHEIKVPAIFISFDDWNIDAWILFAEFIKSHNIPLTFYPCLRQDMRGEYWDEKMARQRTPPVYWAILRSLQNDYGHTIGYHTVNHVRVDAFISGHKEDWFVNQEIKAGLKIFAEQGLHPRHFAYPYGYQTNITDNLLLQYFDTVRDSILPDENQKMKYYTAEEILAKRSFVAYDFKREDILRIAEEGLRQGKVGFYHGHNPYSFKDRIISLIHLANKYNVQYYSMSALDRE